MNQAVVTAPADKEIAPAPLRLRVVLLLLGCAVLAGFYYGNTHTEEFRLAFPRFLPWLWNLYLTCAVLALIGIIALWFSRRWGFWLMAASGVIAVLIGIYAMGFSLIGIGVFASLALVWFAAQPQWESFL